MSSKLSLSSISGTSSITTASFILDKQIVGEAPKFDVAWGSRIGASLAYGDRDGDAINDFIAVGHPDGGLEKSEDLFGGLQGFVEIYCLNENALPTLCLTLHPPHDKPYDFGRQIVAGDFNGNGKTDLIIADPKWIYFGTEAGRLSVIYDDVLDQMISENTVLTDYSAYTIKEIHVPRVSVNHNRFGSQMAVVDNPGKDGLLVQVQNYSVNSSQISYLSRVFYFSDVEAWDQAEAGELGNSALPFSVSNASGTSSNGGFGDSISVLSSQAILISAPYESVSAQSKGVVRSYRVSGTSLVSGPSSTGLVNGSFLGQQIHSADLNCDGVRDSLVSHKTPIETVENFGTIGYYAGNPNVLPQWDSSFLGIRPRITFEDESQPIDPQMVEAFKADGAKLSINASCESVAVSVPFYDEGTEVNKGLVWVYTGTTQNNEVVLDYKNINEAERIQIEIPGQANDLIGNGVVKWLDYDLDGDKDLIVGSDLAGGARGTLTFIKNITGDQPTELSYKDSLMLQSPLAYWMMDEAPPTGVHKSLVNLNYGPNILDGVNLNEMNLGQLVASNAVSLSPGLVANQNGQSYLYDDPESSHLSISDVPLNPLADLTVSFWMRANSLNLGVSRSQIFTITKYSSSDPSQSLYMDLNLNLANSNSKGSLSVRRYIGSQSLPVLQTVSDIVMANQIYHIAVVQTNGALDIYVNGVNQGNIESHGQPIPNVVDTYGMSIGYYGMKTNLDEFAVFDRALSAQEIQTQYNSGF